jgi:tetratricopeptide (TPR) repeat protein
LPAPGTGAGKAVAAAVDAGAQGASAGDARLQRALEFLKAGNAKEAEPLFRAVAEEKAARITADSKDAATAFRNLGAIAGFADPKSALDAYQKAGELDPDDMNSILWVGWMQLQRGNLQEAEARFRRVLPATKPDDWVNYWARIGLGDIGIARGNLAEALKSFRDGLAIAQHLAQADPGNADWQRDLSVSYEKIGDVLVDQGNLPEALKSFRADLAITERLARADPGNAGWQRDLAVSNGRLAGAFRKGGDKAKALDALRQGRAIMVRMTTLSPDNAVWKSDLAWFDGQIAELGR